MRERPPEVSPPPSHEGENRFNPAGLRFEELRAAYELGRTTFRETPDGFESVDGDRIVVKRFADFYAVDNLPNVDRLPSAGHRRILYDELLYGAYANTFRDGTRKREELISNLREALEATGNRIME